MEKTRNLVLIPDPAQLAKVQTARAARLAARRWLRKNSQSPRVAACALTTPKGDVRINVGTCPRTGHRRASASNLITCQSLWACPTCSLKISTARALDLGRANEAWSRADGEKFFVTFTLRHDARQSLEDVWDGLTAAWKYMLGGKGWLNLKTEYGLAGWVRAVEITHGKNGWHVHAHTVFFINPGEIVNDSSFADALWSRWSAGVSHAGHSAERSAFDARRTFYDSPLARYMAKSSNAGLAAELTQGQAKSSRTPFKILHSLVEASQTSCTCDGPRAVAARCSFCLWQEFERTSHGRRQLTWSVGMRDRIVWSSVPEDADDLLIEYIPVLAIGVSSWQTLNERGQVSTLFNALESDGLQAAENLLRHWKCVYSRVVKPFQL